MVVLVVVLVVLVVAFFVVVVACHYHHQESHHQDHQNHHQDRQNTLRDQTIKGFKLKVMTPSLTQTTRTNIVISWTEVNPELTRALAAALERPKSPFRDYYESLKRLLRVS